MDHPLNTMTASGLGPSGSMLPTDDAAWWRERFNRLERAAREAT